MALYVQPYTACQPIPQISPTQPLLPKSPHTSSFNPCIYLNVRQTRGCGQGKRPHNSLRLLHGLGPAWCPQGIRGANLQPMQAHLAPGLPQERDGPPAIVHGASEATLGITLTQPPFSEPRNEKPHTCPSHLSQGSGHQGPWGKRQTKWGCVPHSNAQPPIWPGTGPQEQLSDKWEQGELIDAEQAET